MCKLRQSVRGSNKTNARNLDEKSLNGIDLPFSVSAVSMSERFFLPFLDNEE